MVQLIEPLSIWFQLGNLFFTLSGIHGDLLVIRFFLFLAYLSLVVNSILGSPLWNQPTGDIGSVFAIDSFTWAALNLYVHGSSLVFLLLDERPVTIENDHIQALWRLFYRTGGLSAKLFQTLLEPHVQVIKLIQGEIIPTEDFFYIIYTGRVHLKIIQEDTRFMRPYRVLRSGEMFDMAHLQMFGRNETFFTEEISCRTLTDCVLFRFSKSDLQRIAHHRFAKSIWQALLINNLSLVVEAYGQAKETDGLNVVAVAHHHHTDGVAEEIDRIFAPLEPWEEPTSHYAGSGKALIELPHHMARWMVRSFSPPWPFAGHVSGMRQTMLPPPPTQPPTEQQRKVWTTRIMFGFAPFRKEEGSADDDSSNTSDKSDLNVDDTNGGV